jgi:hypothetical protein
MADLLSARRLVTSTKERQGRLRNRLYALVQGTKENPVLLEDDKFSAPLDYSDAEAMAFFRDRLLSIFKKHEPKTAFIRYGETFLPRKPAPNILASMFARARVEGVILESAHSEGVKIVGASLAGISSKLESKRPRAYLGSGDLRGLDLTGRPVARQEAILVAVSALEK